MRTAATVRAGVAMAAVVLVAAGVLEAPPLLLLWLLRLWLLLVHPYLPRMLSRPFWLGGGPSVRRRSSRRT